MSVMGFGEFTNESLNEKLPLDKKQTSLVHKFCVPRKPLSDDEKATLEAFREKTAEIREDWPEEDDCELTRFLTARGWNIDDAFEMYTSVKDWRKKEMPFKIDAESYYRHLKFRTVEVIENCRDRYNRPLIILTGCRMNPALNNGDYSKLAVSFMWGMEFIISQIIRPYPRFVMIVDLQGWGFKNFDHKIAATLQSVAKPHYADYMGTTFFINYPWVVKGVWKVSEFLLDQRTKDKIHFISKSDHQKLFPILFDPDNLPERFGGNYVEPEYKYGEWDDDVLQEWKDASSLDPVERDAFFEEKLQEYLDSLPEEQAAFWRQIRHTKNMLPTDDCSEEFGSGIDKNGLPLYANYDEYTDLIEQRNQKINERYGLVDEEEEEVNDDSNNNNNEESSKKKKKKKKNKAKNNSEDE